MKFQKTWRKLIPLKWVSVSALVDANFPKFYAGKFLKTERKAKLEAASQSAIFFRQQLFRCLYNEPYATVFEAENSVDFGPELNYFKQFVADKQILKRQHLKVDLPVISKKHKVRGKVALMCGQAGVQTIYGFSASDKIGHVIGTDFVPTTQSAAGQTGISSIEDTKYWREVCKLNVYRAILQSVYGVQVDQMTIVVLNKIYGSYRTLDVPVLDEQALAMLSR